MVDKRAGRGSFFLPSPGRHKIERNTHTHTLLFLSLPLIANRLPFILLPRNLPFFPAFFSLLRQIYFFFSKKKRNINSPFTSQSSHKTIFHFPHSNTLYSSPSFLLSSHTHTSMRRLVYILLYAAATTTSANSCFQYLAEPACALRAAEGCFWNIAFCDNGAGVLPLPQSTPNTVPTVCDPQRTKYDCELNTECLWAAGSGRCLNASLVPPAPPPPPATRSPLTEAPLRVMNTFAPRLATMLPETSSPGSGSDGGGEGIPTYAYVLIGVTVAVVTAAGLWILMTRVGPLAKKDTPTEEMQEKEDPLAPSEGAPSRAGSVRSQYHQSARLTT